MRRNKTRLVRFVVVAVAATILPLANRAPVGAVLNPVATNEATYQAFGRVFPDPQGCLSQDTDGDDVNDLVAPNASPWAKGNVCVAQFIQYEEFVEGSKFLESLYPRFLEVIRFDTRYKNANFRSAGLPRTVSFEGGDAKVLGRDRRPLYMLKVTDEKSPIPENMRYHFAYSGSIHGIERAGAEGQLRAAEDLVTWAANLPKKKIVETETDRPVPTAAEVLKRSVIYFVFPNPDGWGRGQFSPTEFEDGSPNISYTPGVYFQRYNGNGMDLNRDFPTVGYTYRPYTPGSNPETVAHIKVLRTIRSKISPKNPMGQRFAAGIDLHGQLVANSFSYTLAGAGQRDFRKNFLTIDQGLRTWADQTDRLAWSPYIGGLFANADEWGTTIDTIGYTITGPIGDWFESEELGLGAIGIDNEMSLSHITPNTVYDPTTEQMHIDGNKGLIYSQISSMLTEKPLQYKPSGKIGYVHNPHRIRVGAKPRVRAAKLPAQEDIEVLVPCHSMDYAGPGSCDTPDVTWNAEESALEFTVKGPKDGFFNGGVKAEMTNLNVTGVGLGTLSRIVLEQFDEGEWDTVNESFVQAGSPDLYLQSGQDVAVNDPAPGKWRARITNPVGGLPARLKIDFDPVMSEISYGQAPIDASSMDFYKDLNKYIKDPRKKLTGVSTSAIGASPQRLKAYDSLVVTNNMGNAKYLREKLKMSPTAIKRYFAGLKSFAANGGNLVLTDAALGALPEIGILKKGDVKTKRFLAGRYEYGSECNKTPLTRNVCLEGTAGGTSRQAVEPTPIGYSPDVDLDDAQSRLMPAWYVNSEKWDSGCTSACAEAALGGNVSGEAGPANAAALGKRKLGKGRVAIAGIMFPDPNFAPGGPADMRFGLASYALTFSAWQTFLNLVDYKR